MNYIEFPEEGTTALVNIAPDTKQVFAMPIYGYMPDDGCYITPLGPVDANDILAVRTPDGWVHDLHTDRNYESTAAWMTARGHGPGAA